MYTKVLAVLVLLVAAAGCAMLDSGTANVGQVPENAGVLAITANTRGADVLVDGALVATIMRAERRQNVIIEAGEHNLEVTKFGYKPWSAKISLVSGVANTIEVNLERLPTEAVEVPE